MNKLKESMIIYENFDRFCTKYFLLPNKVNKNEFTLYSFRQQCQL